MADYLRNGSFHGAPFRSTQSGNFDLFLPFIEQGISLLNPDGRLGFIAPSLWTKNEYGEGLRSLVRDGRHLDRWIDFEAFQVFDEAITHTALQFYPPVDDADYQVPFRFTGTLNNVSFKLGPSELPPKNN